LLVKKLKFYGRTFTLCVGQQVSLSIRRERTMKWAWQQSAVLAIFERSSSAPALTLINYADFLDISGATNGEVEKCGCDFPWAKSKAMSWQKL